MNVIGLYTIAGFSVAIGLSLSVCAQTADAPKSPALVPTAGNASRLDPEMQKAIIDALPRPSFDTTPVNIKIKNVTYRIPRNYLSNMSSIPVVEVTVPGPNFTVPAFQPLAEDNKACFSSLQQGWDAGCQSVQFLIGTGGGRSAEKQLELLQQSPANKTPREGPFGYDFYGYQTDELSQDEKLARPPTPQWYAKYHHGHLVFFECLVNYKRVESLVIKHIIFCEDRILLDVWSQGLLDRV